MLPGPPIKNPFKNLQVIILKTEGFVAQIIVIKALKRCVKIRIRFRPLESARTPQRKLLKAPPTRKQTFKRLNWKDVRFNSHCAAGKM